MHNRHNRILVHQPCVTVLSIYLSLLLQYILLYCNEVLTCPYLLLVTKFFLNHLIASSSFHHLCVAQVLLGLYQSMMCLKKIQLHITFSSRIMENNHTRHCYVTYSFLSVSLLMWNIFSRLGLYVKQERFWLRTWPTICTLVSQKPRLKEAN